MKRRKEHKVLLTPQTFKILETIHSISGHREFVFPSPYNTAKHVNNESVNTALKRMGFKNRLLSYGLRALASTTLNEHAWDADLIEVALSHGDSTIRGVYNGPEYLERRRVMMQWWSNQIGEASFLKSEIVSSKKHLKIIAA